MDKAEILENLQNPTDSVAKNSYERDGPLSL